MEIENSSYGGDPESGKNLENSTSDHVNGLSNGYSSENKHKSHKSDHKDKHRDKDRDRDRDRDRDKDKDRSKSHKSSSKDKDRDRERDKDKHSSSKDKDRHSSSHKSSSRDKDRDKERSDRDKDRSDRDKDRSDRDKDKHRDKDKDKHRSDKEKSSSSSHKSSSRDKDRDRERDKDKEKSSSSSKDKDRRDRDKEREKDRDKDRERDKDKEKSRHSSSSKDKDKDRHKDKSSKDKDRHSSSKDKDKERHREKDKENKYESKNEVKIKEEVKQEEEEVDIPQHVEPQSAEEEEEVEVKKEEQDDSYEEKEDVNVSAASSCDYNLSSFKTEPEESDEDLPLRRIPRIPKLANRREEQKAKRKIESEDEDDDVPLSARKKPKTEEKKKKKRPASSEDDDDEEDYYSPKKSKEKKKHKKEVKKEVKKEIKRETNDDSPKKKKKGQEEEQEVWKWWEEEKKDDGTKWTFLEHKGPVFAPPYEPLPSHIKFYYDGKEMRLSEDAEEVAGFYAKMLDHDYTTKDIFNENFFKDWRKCMNEKEKSIITDLKKCNFKPMHKYFMEVAEQNRNRSKEEKKALKEKNEELLKEYGFCTIDGHKEKIGNFKIEPPGLFRGRGEHPKMGKLKRRVMPEDILINCSKDSKIPDPPKGHKWKEVRHDPNVTWLASWTENVQNQVKYIMLNPSSKLKGEKDMQKYETARKLHRQIDKIRNQYKEDWKSKEMRIRQRAVALYFIDKLALRAGNEKDEDQADTVGCCSLRVEHIELHEEKDGKDYVVVFDFLGKDSIRYYNEVPVEKRVFKNLQLFMENKNEGDDLFDRLNTAILNKHLNELMEGLTAKVFRTYNASSTLQEQLDLLTNEDDSVAEKILSYNRANRAVAILCNHQRSVPKGHEKSMEKLKEKIEQKREQIAEMQKQVKDAAKDAKHGSVKEKMVHDKKKKALERLKDQLKKLEVQETDRDENKTIALGTSKLNYLDPRISVAWCKKYDVPIEKIYNKTQRDKFRWAIDMAGPDYRF